MRPVCASCHRPQTVCLCSVLPAQPIKTTTKVIILQHPHETRHKLTTVPILSLCLANCDIIVGRRIRSGTCQLLDEFASSADSSVSSASTSSVQGPVVQETARTGPCRSKNSVLFLFPSPSAIDLQGWLSSSQNSPSSFDASTQPVCVLDNPVSETSSSGDCVESEASALTQLSRFIPSLYGSSCTGVISEAHEPIAPKEQRAAALVHRPVILLIVDGTWQHAKEMMKASLPFLSDFAVQVCLPHDITRAGWGIGDTDSILRKEPFAGCVSTMEAVARCLAILEPDGIEIEKTLLAVLRHMVSLQSTHIAPLKPRPHTNNEKTSKLA